MLFIFKLLLLLNFLALLIPDGYEHDFANTTSLREFLSKNQNLFENPLDPNFLVLIYLPIDSMMENNRLHIMFFNRESGLYTESTYNKSSLKIVDIESNIQKGLLFLSIFQKEFHSDQLKYSNLFFTKEFKEIQKTIIFYNQEEIKQQGEGQIFDFTPLYVNKKFAPINPKKDEKKPLMLIFQSPEFFRLDCMLSKNWEWEKQVREKMMKLIEEKENLKKDVFQENFKQLEEQLSVSIDYNLDNFLKEFSLKESNIILTFKGKNLKNQFLTTSEKVEEMYQVVNRLCYQNYLFLKNQKEDGFADFIARND